MFRKQSLRASKKVKKREKCSNKQASQIISDFDSFGEPVSLRYNGTSANNTVIGGILSIFLHVGIIFYFFWRVKLLSNRERDKLMQTDFYRNLTDSDETESHFKLKDNHFKFWIQMNDPDFDNDDNEYIKFKLHRYSNLESDSSELIDKEIPMVSCQNEHVDTALASIWYSGKYYCPDYSDEDFLYANYYYSK